jgi:hypothetical protein
MDSFLVVGIKSPGTGGYLKQVAGAKSRRTDILDLVIHSMGLSLFVRGPSPRLFKARTTQDPKLKWSDGISEF